ncbi:[Fe-Fe] hydrogenase large subunit C-terminal domain-containing protein [Garciella nitratireducens]|uniref:PAS domain S-box-containing protein n=1 Tax=Garciella nitratireducens DSM 15102 TaxID=1121911 RepID=A0A1T4KQE6_9FIRM|nr:[Fe-Fe] hydrogenase large subunit C-terminal domain-containing protein [Garciella nitratireducens]SJZ44646.1 PAS domain S-box-containing protein [Garciella nitratireducens DSM 15102]
MNIINFTEANCKNCYKCVRSCPVKAIMVKNEQAEIVTERCIGCGICLQTCPQNAKNIKSDLKEIQKWIQEGKKVVASIAPSFPAAFQLEQEEQIVTALKKLGFQRVEETAIGAELVSRVYKRLYDHSSWEHVITTSCPTINYLIERYHPSLVKYMAPVVSPMIAHGKLLKKRFGKETKIVFIGPCISKKFEILHFQHDDVIDGMITFDELHYWLKESRFCLRELPVSSFDSIQCNEARWYPLAGGVAYSVLKGKEDRRTVIKVDGIENCIDLFESLKKGQISNSWIEINACSGGCINGPGIQLSPWGKCIRREKVIEYIHKKRSLNTFDKDILDSVREKQLFKVFMERPIQAKIPTEEQIKEILQNIGKYKKEDELNCGGCGYNTCREKAIAVFQGMAEKYMCLPYMRSRGETLSNFIIQNTPNAIIVLDQDLNIVEFNPSAEKLFGYKDSEVLKKPIQMIMQNSGFEKVQRDKKLIYRGNHCLEDYEIAVWETVLYIKEQAMYLGIFSDITQEMKDKESIRKMRENTLNMTQEVIDKQMRVAQKIASLLGETTAETKVTLNQLKRLVQSQEGEL